MRYFEEYCEVHLEPTLAPHQWVFRSDEPIRIRFGIALANSPVLGEVWYQVADGAGFRQEGRLPAETEGVTQNGYMLFAVTLPSVFDGCYCYRLGYRDADGCEHTSEQIRRIFVDDASPRSMAEIGATFLGIVDGQPLYGPPPQVPISPGPRDWHSRLLYSILTDRFAHAEPNLRAGIGPVTYDPTSAYAGHGGTLRGIIEKLRYIKALGVGVILLSPVYTNNSAGYHGYYLTHLLMVDPGQGTLADLRALVAEAHRLDMAVILDVVCNHIGDSITWTPLRQAPRLDPTGWHYTDPATAGTVGEFHYISGYRERHMRERISYVGSHDTPVLPYPVEARNPALFHGDEYTDLVRQRLFGVMEDWRTEIPYVRNLLIDHLKYWIAATDIDGFRHDAARHIEPEFWQACITEIDHYTRFIGKTNFIHLAEHAGMSAAELISYNRAGFPSLFDFPTFYKVIGSLDAPNRLQGLADYFCGYLQPKEVYGVDWRDNVMFLDGHDRSRLLHEFLIRLPTRELAHTCFHFALACLILGPQTPILYYGTEQEFFGALGSYQWEATGEWFGHPECGWQFGPLNHPTFPPYHTAHFTFQLIRQLADVRARYASLMRGVRTVLPTTDANLRCLLLHDEHSTETMLVIMNFGPESVSEPALVLPKWRHPLTTLTPLVGTAGGTVQQELGYLKIYLLPGAFYVGILSLISADTGFTYAPNLHFAKGTKITSSAIANGKTNGQTNISFNDYPTVIAVGPNKEGSIQ
jgi:glycosidase